MVNFLCAFVGTLGFCTWAVPIFDLHTIPWANDDVTHNFTNATQTVAPDILKLAEILTM